MKRTNILIAALAAAILTAFMAAPAMARRVANPGPVSLRFESGTFVLGSETADAADPSDPITAGGTVAGNGELRITSLAFPTIEVENNSGIGPNPIHVNVIPQQIPGQPAGVVGYGNLNALTGATTLQMRISVKIEEFSSDCYIGPPSSPIVLNMTTGTTSPPGPNGPITGSPYNTTTGFLTLVDNAFAVPGASGCEYAFIGVNGQINDELGLPSAAGRNSARLTASSSPIIQPGIVPSFTATPSSGVAPLNAAFNASATTAAAGVQRYEWDFDGNGSTDATTTVPTTSHVYSIPGTYQPRLRVVDNEGDAVTTTRTVIVDTPRPDLAITKTHDGPFVSGQSRSWDIGVVNAGTLATSGPATVTDTLPAGFAFDGSSGTDWTCGVSGQVVTCTYGPSLAIGESAPTLTIDAVAPLPGNYVNTASVSTPGDINASNNSASDATQVVAAGIDLAMHKTHDADEGLFRGRRATYILTVANEGVLATTGRTRVVDELPAGVSPVSASGGLEWVCSISGQTVSCFSDRVVAPGEAFRAIRIRVDVASNAPNVISNTASVSTPGESNSANDSGTDAATVLGYGADYAIELDRASDLVVGLPAFYNVSVTNVGTAIAGDTVTVEDLLPPGLTFAGADGDGWMCGASGHLVTCTRPGPVDAGQRLPALAIQVDVSSAAAPTALNQVRVSSPDDFNGLNDTAQDSADVRLPMPDLSVDLSHAASHLVVGELGQYSVAVTNEAAEPTSGATSVTVDVPAALTLVDASGAGWSCATGGQAATCTRAAMIEPDETAPAITVEVQPTAAAIPSVVTTADVTTAGDTSAANDHDEDPTLVKAAPLPTRVVADGVLLHRETGATRISFNGPRARLRTTSNAPVVNREIVFTGTTSGVEICRARTDYLGDARCGTLLIPMVVALLDTRYEARWHGDDAYAPSVGQGALVQAGAIRI